MKFVTRISDEVDGELEIRGMKYLEIMRTMEFVSAIYFILTGRKPTKGQLKVFNAMLTASIDHGIKPATGFVPMVVAASGNEMTHALAAGLLTIGPYHGGAIDGAAKMFHEYAHNGATSIADLVSQMRAQHRRIPGFGHKFYKDVDPRAQFLIELAKKEGYAGDYVTIALEFEKAIEKELGSKKVLNIDGVVAALILEIGLPANAGNGIFALARIGGMIAHVLEEMENKTVVRRLEDDEVEYVRSETK